MTVNKIEADPELRQVLWACYKYWQTEETSPPHERVICYTWAVEPYEEKFGTRFHQSKLQRLAKLGFLRQVDTARGGHRRYYAIVAPDQVHDLLKRWGMS